MPSQSPQFSESQSKRTVNRSALSAHTQSVQHPLVRLQAQIGNQAVQRLLAAQPARNVQTSVIQREWVKGTGKTSAYPSGHITNTLRDLVDDVNEVSGVVGTIVGGKGGGDASARIDFQGYTSEGLANIQAQYKDATWGGVICPLDLDIETIRAGLRKAIKDQVIYEWSGDESEEEEEYEEQDTGEDLLDPDWVASQTDDTTTGMGQEKTLPYLPHY